MTPVDVASEGRQFHVLFRSFLRRLLDNDLVPEGADVGDALYWLVPMFAAPTALIGLRLFPKYALIADIAPESFAALSWPDKLFFLGYSMTAVGLLTVLLMDSLFPGREDAVNLGPLPVRGRTVVAAKLGALSFFVVGFAVVINLPAACTFAVAAAGSYGTPLAVARYSFAHLLSSVAGGAFVFLLLVALHTTIAVLLPPRLARTAAVWAQLGFVVLLIEWFLFSPALLERWSADWSSSSGGTLDWSPPLWFLGLYEVLLGGERDGFRALASRAGVALVSTLAISVALYASSYGRIVRREISSEGNPPRPPGPLARLARRMLPLVVPDPTAQAVFTFAARTLVRSRRHRLLVAMSVGFGLAFVVAGFLGPALRGDTTVLFQPTVNLLSIPLVLSFFVLVALRLLFAVPSELSANWIFQMTEWESKERYLQGVQRTMVLAGNAPLVAVTFPVYAYLWGPTLAIQHTLLWLALAALLAEALLVGFQKVPFTCAYAPGRGNVKLLWPLYLFGMLAYAYGTARVEMWLLRDSARWLTASVVLLLVYAVCAVRRRRESRKASRFLYADGGDTPVQVLGLSES